MSAADEVRVYICGSLLDLGRRLDAETAAEIARAVAQGAHEALDTLSADALETAPERPAGDLPRILGDDEMARH